MHQPLPLGATIGTLSSWRSTNLDGISHSSLANVFTVLATMSKFWTELRAPNICRSSMKNFPSHLNPWSLRSFEHAGMFLYASTMSGFDIVLPPPDSTSINPNCLADVIFTFSRFVLSTLSLKLRPSGSDTLIQILVFVGCGMARMGFTLNNGRGGFVKGPATYFLFIQELFLDNLFLKKKRHCSIVS